MVYWKESCHSNEEDTVLFTEILATDQASLTLVLAIFNSSFSLFYIYVY